VSAQVRSALSIVVLEFDHGIKNIPLLVFLQARTLEELFVDSTHRIGRCNLYKSMNL
jgi:hypothetical protein